MRTKPFSGTDGCGTLLMCLKRVKIPEEVLPSENQVIGISYMETIELQPIHSQLGMTN